jgi:DNA-binding XRE family transcriptional regulator
MGDVVKLSARENGKAVRRIDVGDRRPEQERLWRELVGDRLRQERRARGERLADVAERAGVSTQYLSEIERGLKDPSSEMLEAIAGALELTVRQLAARVSASGIMCLAA